jgi:hypothetical protein
MQICIHSYVHIHARQQLEYTLKLEKREVDLLVPVGITNQK